MLSDSAENSTPRYGLPEWKPISETRHANITTMFKVECYGCGFDPQFASTPALAKAMAETHDKTHFKNMAECCMHSRRAVCVCGKVLV